LPEVIEIQLTLLNAIQLQVDDAVTVTLSVPPPDRKYWLVGEMVGEQGGGWVALSIR
jgi:hypothetical protein